MLLVLPIRLKTIRRPSTGGSRRLHLLLCGLAVAVALCQSASVWAKETDSFTLRYEVLAFPHGDFQGRPVADFTDELNTRVNSIVADVLTRLNDDSKRAGRTCLDPRVRRRLFRQLSDSLGGPIIFTRNRLRPAINNSPNHFKKKSTESIYRDFPPWRSISLGLLTKFGDKMAQNFRFDLQEILSEGAGPIVRLPDGSLRVPGTLASRSAKILRLKTPGPAVWTIDGRALFLLQNGQALVQSGGTIYRLTPIIVSSDKFSHFFNRSMRLFKRLRSGHESSLEETLADNYRLEASILGSLSTGVAAYGDLVANFQGMRFWAHLLAEDLEGRPLVDPLDEGPIDPYVTCSAGGRWVQAREIDIQSYLDPSWDEGLNCSKFRSTRLLDMVVRRIEELNRGDVLGNSYDCPVDPALIHETAETYGEFAPLLINSAGHQALRSAGGVR